MAIFSRGVSPTPVVLVHDDAPALMLEQLGREVAVRNIIENDGNGLSIEKLESAVAPAMARKAAAEPTAAQPDVAAANTTDNSSTPTVGSTFWATGIFAGGVVAAVFLFGTPGWGPTFKPAEGIGAFALFYVAAQASERLVELALPYVDNRNGEGKKGKKAKEKARDAAVASAKALTADRTKMTEAANAQAEVDQLRANRTVLAFGITAALGVMLCGFLEADFLSSVGVNFGTDPNNWMDVVRMVVTALVVGGGAKGLHDTISSISKSNEQKSTPKETGGQA